METDKERGKKSVSKNIYTFVFMLHELFAFCSVCQVHLTFGLSILRLIEQTTTEKSRTKKSILSDCCGCTLNHAN